MRRAWLIAPALALAAVVTSPRAQMPREEDWLQRYLYPPDLIMEHQQEIGLDASQSEAIRQELKKAQSRFLDIQWEMHGEAEKLNRILQSSRVDEAAALAQAGKVMGMENEVKKAHLALVIRIKNLLTEDQQARLSQMKPPARPLPPSLPPPHDHP